MYLLLMCPKGSLFLQASVQMPLATLETRHLMMWLLNSHQASGSPEDKAWSLCYIWKVVGNSVVGNVNESLTMNPGTTPISGFHDL